MKNFVVVCSAMLLFLVSCTESTPVKVFYGEKFEAVDVISADALLEKLDATAVLDEVYVEGTISKSCTHSGCWMMLANEKGAEILVTYKDDAFTTSKKIKDRKVTIKGYAERGEAADSYKIIASGLILN